MAKTKNVQKRALDTARRRFGIQGLGIDERSDAVIVEYKGVHCLLTEKRGPMSVDYLNKKFDGSIAVFRLPEDIYQFLMWLHNYGWGSDMFKTVARRQLCPMCAKHYNATIPSAFAVNTKNGVEFMCPEHAINYPLVGILLEER